MQENTQQRRLTTWMLIATVWLGLGLIDASQTVFPMRALGMHHAWVRLFVTQVAAWLPWVLATPVIVHFARGYPPFRPPRARGIAVHLTAIIVMNLTSATWVAWLNLVFDPWLQDGGPGPYLKLWVSKAAYGGLTALVVYAFIVTITLALDSRARIALAQAETARLSAQLSKAQLDALRQQMNPHFMFNTLNAISGLVRDQRYDAAVTMVAGLSDFMRRTAQDNKRPQVALAEEVEYLKRYLEIQQVRFGERLQASMQIDADALPVLVPILMLQPLIENAIKHGIEKRVQGGVIRTTAARSEDRLHLRIYNDGPQALPDEVGTTGIGLSNLRSRLQILYGADFRFELRSAPEGGTEVLLDLPVCLA
jgi:two-component system, LytTR family, sensor kinase